jgi:hypothetical protein
VRNGLSVDSFEPRTYFQIDEEKRGKFLSHCVLLLGKVANADSTAELHDIGNELQSAGLVLRSELSIEELLA